MSDEVTYLRGPRLGERMLRWVALFLCCTALGCADGEAQLAHADASRDPTRLDTHGFDGAAGATDEQPRARPDPSKRTLAGLEPFGRGIDHVLLISVDGLAARFLRELLDEDRVSTFAELGRLGAYTLNARTDTTYTNTLPNHTSMLTGLPVMAPPGAPEEQGHGYTANTDPASDSTLHNSGNPARTYTPSVFDVVHDYGMSTAMFASKTKFSLYSNSYNDAGAPDQTGDDDGTAKIDTVEINVDIVGMTDALVAKLESAPPNFTFIHFNQPDATGHSLSWGGEEYLAAVVTVDGQLKRIFSAIRSNPRLAPVTAVILTTDHGGTGYSHLDASNYENFVIPFYVWAPGTAGRKDLYSLVPDYRMPPPDHENPGFEEPEQPIRNGDSGNLALELLGLPAIPGSLMHPFGLARSTNPRRQAPRGN